MPGVTIILNMRNISKNHDTWFLKYEAQQVEFFVILDHFLLFHLPHDLKNQNFEKLKKIPQNIIILHMYTRNHDHILHC